jgi:hypothetical protein
MQDDFRSGVGKNVPRLSLTPDEAAEATGFSRTRIFQAIREGKLVARGDGKATIVEVQELARGIRSMPPKGRQTSPTVESAGAAA